MVEFDDGIADMDAQGQEFFPGFQAGRDLDDFKWLSAGDLMQIQNIH